MMAEGVDEAAFQPPPIGEHGLELTRSQPSGATIRRVLLIREMMANSPFQQSEHIQPRGGRDQDHPVGGRHPGLQFTVRVIPVKDPLHRPDEAGHDLPAPLQGQKPGVRCPEMPVEMDDVQPQALTQPPGQRGLSTAARAQDQDPPDAGRHLGPGSPAAEAPGTGAMTDPSVSRTASPVFGPSRDRS